MRCLRAYTDGSCLNQAHKNSEDPNLQRIGGVGVFFSDDSEWNVSETFTMDNPTNNRAELYAFKAAMEIMWNHYNTIKNDHKKFRYHIYSDSQYTLNCFTQNEKTPRIRPYCELWKPYGWKIGDGPKGWEKSNNDIPENLDLIIPMYELHQKFKEHKHIELQMHKVKAHRKKAPDDPTEYKYWYGNKMADELATAASLGVRIQRQAAENIPNSITRISKTKK